MTRRRFLISVGAASIGMAGCAGRSPSTVNGDAFRTAMERIEQRSAGRLGVTLIDTGTQARQSWRGDERFPMCSTFKLSAAALVLNRVDRGLEQLERRVVYGAPDVVTYSPITESRTGGTGLSLAELCEAAVTLSDNTAGNLMMRSFGGPQALTSFFRQIGDEHSRLDRWETDLNTSIPGDPRDTTTPDAMAQSIRRLVLGDVLAPNSREQLRKWLLGNKVGDTRLRQGVPGGWRVADKTGAGPNGTNNDVGVLFPPSGAPLVVSCYLTGAGGETKDRDAVIAEVARAIVLVSQRA